MEEKTVKRMIERFFAAELTVEEEWELCSYLRENDVPAGLCADKEAIIALCSEPVDVELPDGAAERLEAMLDGLEEQQHKQHSNETETANSQRRLLRIPRMLVGGAVAAAVLLFAYIAVQNNEKWSEQNIPELTAETLAEPFEEDTFDNPEDAMHCFKAACNDIMLAMNSVSDNTREIGNAIKKSVAPYKEIIKINRQ